MAAVRSDMTGFVFWRLVGFAPVLIVALVLTFLAIRALPGDPVVVMLGDRSSDPELSSLLRRQYGLDQPLGVQFLRYVTGVVQGDFGLSYRYAGTPVTEIIADGLLISPVLAAAALALALPVGAIAGSFAAVRRNSAADVGVVLMLVLGLSVPNFAIATILVFLLSVKLGLLPVAGWGSLSQAVLPVVVLALPTAAYIARLSRTFMLEVLQQDYIRTARAKGLSERIVIYRHAFRNTMVPVVTSAGITLGALLSNAFVVETIFNIPGLGRLAIDSIFARDYPVAMAIVILFTFLFVLINFMVDLAYILIDPRIRASVVARGGRA